MKNWEEELQNFFEYDGIWHKKGKNGECEKFIMNDLVELLKSQRHSLIEEMENFIPKWLKSSVMHTERDRESVECFLEYFKREF